MGKLLNIVLLVSFLPLMAFSQVKGGDIYGEIILPSGSRVAEVLVTLIGEHVGERFTKSSRDGSFRFFELPPGAYSLRFEKRGFKPFTREHIEIIPEHVNQLVVNLQKRLVKISRKPAGKTMASRVPLASPRK